MAPSARPSAPPRPAPPRPAVAAHVRTQLKLRSHAIIHSTALLGCAPRVPQSKPITGAKGNAANEARVSQALRMGHRCVGSGHAAKVAGAPVVRGCLAAPASAVSDSGKPELLACATSGRASAARTMFHVARFMLHVVACCTEAMLCIAPYTRWVGQSERRRSVGSENRSMRALLSGSAQCRSHRMRDGPWPSVLWDLCHEGRQWREGVELHDS